MEKQNLETSGKPTQVQAPVKSSLNLMLIIPLVVIVIAIVVGAVWFMAGGRTSETVRSVPSSPTTQTQPASTLEGELNAIDIESNDPDFKDVDRDLQSL